MAILRMIRVEKLPDLFSYKNVCISLMYDDLDLLVNEMDSILWHNSRFGDLFQRVHDTEADTNDPCTYNGSDNPSPSDH